MSDLATKLIDLDELGYFEYSVPVDDPNSVRIEATTYSVMLEVILNGKYYYREVGLQRSSAVFDFESLANEMREQVQGDPFRGFDLLLDLNITGGYFPRKIYFAVMRDTTSFEVIDHVIPEAGTMEGRSVYLANTYDNQSIVLQFEWAEDAESFFDYIQRRKSHSGSWDNMVFDLIQNLTLIKELKDAEADHVS